MATWKLNPAFESVSNKLGNMVFYNSEGDTFARKRPEKRTTSTVAQDEIKKSFTDLSGCWKHLEGAVQNSWIIYAKKKKRLRGHSAFIGANVTRQRQGEPLEMSKSIGEQGLRSFSARTGSASGEINCEFTRQTGDTEKYITFFLQKKLNGLGENRITRVETEAGVVSPFTITGAEPGSEYFVYAIVTNRAYAEAETVSMAHSAICIAGQ